MDDTYITPNLSKHDYYCIEICKGKCCYTYKNEKCPNLGEDFRCKIHHLWRDDWCYYNSGNIKTAPIMYAIKHNLLRSEILKGCCYAHPELLKVIDGI